VITLKTEPKYYNVLSLALLFEPNLPLRRHYPVTLTLSQSPLMQKAKVGLARHLHYITCRPRVWQSYISAF